MIVKPGTRPWLGRVASKGWGSSTSARVVYQLSRQGNNMSEGGHVREGGLGGWKGLVPSSSCRDGFSSAKGRLG